MTLYVGVDPSITNTGIVVLDNSGAVLSAVNTRALPTNYNNYYLKLRSISNNVLSVLQQYDDNSKKIYYEDYSYSSVNRTYQLGELGGLLRTALIEAYGSIYFIAPRLLKKFAVGNGNADKSDIINSALVEDTYFASIGKKQLSSDICDAYYLARFGWYVDNFEKVDYKPLLRQRLETVRGYRDDTFSSH